jgi:hypothetical protein
VYSIRFPISCCGGKRSGASTSIVIYPLDKDSKPYSIETEWTNEEEAKLVFTCLHHCLICTGHDGTWRVSSKGEDRYSEQHHKDPWSAMLEWQEKTQAHFQELVKTFVEPPTPVHKVIGIARPKSLH